MYNFDLNNNVNKFTVNNTMEFNLFRFSLLYL